MLCSWTEGRSQELSVPLEIQYQLIQKVLTFNRSLLPRTKQTLTIGIIYQRSYRISNTIKESLLSASGPGTPSLRLIPIDLTEVGPFADFPRLGEIDALYIAPLRAYPVESLARITREKKILTLTGSPQYIDMGIAVGFGVRSNRPEIIINLNAAREEGADFSSQLLKLSKVIQ